MRQETKRCGRRFQSIKAWQRADALVVLAYGASRSFPKDEQYGLASQLRRAAVSVAANIVEGSSRQSRPEYAHFLSISKASLNEVAYYFHLARRLGYVSEPVFGKLDEAYEETARTLYGLIQSVSKEETEVLQPA